MIWLPKQKNNLILETGIKKGNGCEPIMWTTRH